MEDIQEVLKLLRREEYGKVEEIWIEGLEEEDLDLDFYLDVAKEMKRCNQESSLIALVELLDEELSGNEFMEERIELNGYMARLLPDQKEFRKRLMETFKTKWDNRKSIEAILDRVGFNSSPNPVSTLPAAEKWIKYDINTTVLHESMGPGRVYDVNLQLDLIRVRFSDGREETYKIDVAPSALKTISDDHILYKKINTPRELTVMAETDQEALLDLLFKSFDKAMNNKEIKEILSGIVSEGKWTKWWAAARKNPRMISSGGSKPLYSWSASAESATDLISDQFKSADIDRKMEILSQEVSRGSDQVNEFIEILQKDIIAHRTENPGKALNLLISLDRMTGYSNPIIAEEIKSIIADQKLSDLWKEIKDRNNQDRLFKLFPEYRQNDWVSEFLDIFKNEKDQRVFTQVSLAIKKQGDNEKFLQTLKEISEFPRRYPNHFIWLLKEAISGLSKVPHLDLSLLFQVLDVIGGETDKKIKSALEKILYDGHLLERVMDNCSESDVNLLKSRMARAGAVEEKVRSRMQVIVQRRFPEIETMSKDDYIYVSAQAAERQRAILADIVENQIPANSKALAEAAAMGDLRENFEYQSARENHNKLTQRAESLNEEIGKIRIINRDNLKDGEVTLGTTLTLIRDDNGSDRTLTILGPWDSDPDSGVYSYMAPLGEKLIGKKVGDTVKVEGDSYEIKDISPWEGLR